MRNNPVCPICEEGEGLEDGRRAVYHFDCARCGRFAITVEAIDVVTREHRGECWKVAGAVREMSERTRGEFLITRADISGLVSQSPAVFDVSGKARKLLAAVARRSRTPGTYVRLRYATDFPLAYAENDANEFLYVIRYIAELGWVTNLQALEEASVCLTPKGWEETRAKSHLDSSKAFVAMWFSTLTDDAWTDGIKPAIERAGYDAMRVDSQEFNGDIVDRILGEIKESKFLVSDLTTDGAGDRGGVYFEAGFAMGLGLPVIFTFSDKLEGGRGPHFDVAHYNQVRWANAEQLQEKLYNRILVTIGRGPLPYHES